MLYDVVAVKARDPFKIWIRFEDGTEGEADLSDLAGRGVFKRWTEDPSEFAQATAIRRAAQWCGPAASMSRPTVCTKTLSGHSLVFPSSPHFSFRIASASVARST